MYTSAPGSVKVYRIRRTRCSFAHLYQEVCSDNSEHSCVVQDTTQLTGFRSVHTFARTARTPVRRARACRHGPSPHLQPHPPPPMTPTTLSTHRLTAFHARTTERAARAPRHDRHTTSAKNGPEAGAPPTRAPLLPAPRLSRLPAPRSHPGAESGAFEPRTSLLFSRVQEVHSSGGWVLSSSCSFRSAPVRGCSSELQLRPGSHSCSGCEAACSRQPSSWRMQRRRCPRTRRNPRRSQKRRLGRLG